MSCLGRVRVERSVFLVGSMLVGSTTSVRSFSRAEPVMPLLELISVEFFVLLQQLACFAFPTFVLGGLQSDVFLPLPDHSFVDSSFLARNTAWTDASFLVFGMCWLGFSMLVTDFVEAESPVLMRHSTRADSSFLVVRMAQPELALLLSDFMSAGFSVSFRSWARTGLAMPPSDLINAGPSVSLRTFLQAGSSTLPSGILRGEASMPPADFAEFGPFLTMRSSSRAEPSTPVIRAFRLGLCLFAVDLTTIGSMPSARHFLRLGLIMAAPGTGRSDSSTSVLDPLHLDMLLLPRSFTQLDMMMLAPKASEAGVSLSLRRTVHVGSLLLLMGVASTESAPSVLDVVDSGSSSAIRNPARLGLTSSVCALARSEVFAVAPDPLHLGSSPVLQSYACPGLPLSTLAMGHIDSLSPLQKYICLGTSLLASGLARLGLALLASSFSMSDSMLFLQTSTCLAVLLSLFGLGRTGSPLLAVGCVETGSPLLLRAALRLGASTSSIGTCNFGGAMSILDYTTLGSLMPTRNYGCFDSMLPTFGACGLESPFIVLDSAALGFLLLGCISCAPDLVVMPLVGFASYSYLSRIFVPLPPPSCRCGAPHGWARQQAFLEFRVWCGGTKLGAPVAVLVYRFLPLILFTLAARRFRGVFPALGWPFQLLNWPAWACLGSALVTSGFTRLEVLPMVCDFAKMDSAMPLQGFASLSPMLLVMGLIRLGLPESALVLDFLRGFPRERAKASGDRCGPSSPPCGALKLGFLLAFGQERSILLAFALFACGFQETGPLLPPRQLSRLASPSPLPGTNRLGLQVAKSDLVLPSRSLSRPEMLPAASRLSRLEASMLAPEMSQLGFLLMLRWELIHARLIIPITESSLLLRPICLVRSMSGTGKLGLPPPAVDLSFAPASGRGLDILEETGVFWPVCDLGPHSRIFATDPGYSPCAQGDATFGGNVNLVGHLDMSPPALGGVRFDLPPTASDSLHLGLLLPLHSLACPETLSSTSASSRSDAFLPLRQLAQPGSPSMPIGTACLESTLAVHENVYPGFAIHFNGANNYIYYDTGATELRVHAGGLKRMSISSTGGSLHGTWSSESIISASDQRLKRRIEPLEGTLASRAMQRTSSERGSEGESDRAKAVGWLLRELRPVSYYFKEGPDAKYVSFVEKSYLGQFFMWLWRLPERLRVAQHQRLTLRGAKILRWECDTPLAREMAAYPEAADFLSFCLERSGDFSKRDWLASLTLLTVRKRFSTSLPQFQEYSQLLVSKADVHFQDSVHLLLHRYGVLGYAPAVWRLLPLMAARIPLMTPKQLALCAWGLGQPARRTLVHDDQAWTSLGAALCDRAQEFLLADLAMYAWGWAAVDRVSPSEVVVLKQAVRNLLFGQSLPESSHNLCILLKALGKLTPDDRRFLEWLLLLMLEAMETRSISFAAQGLTSIWAALGMLKWRPEERMLEVLCEESRRLRLDHTFNQDMAAELAKALLILDVDDARPVYQVADYVARRGLSLRADTLLVLAEFFAARGVSHDLAWKRLGVRAQQRGVDLRLHDIDRLVAAFRRAGRGNQRIYGMLYGFVAQELEQVMPELVRSHKDRKHVVYQDLIALLTLASQVQQDRLAAHEARARERAQKLKDQDNRLQTLLVQTSQAFSVSRSPKVRSFPCLVLLSFVNRATAPLSICPQLLMTDGFAEDEGPGCQEAEEVSDALFSVASDAAASGVPRVMCCEADGSLPEDIYSFLGGRSRLVEPVLHGHRSFIGCYGSPALGLPVLNSLLRPASCDMMTGAARLAPQRLLRLGVSLLECCEDEQPQWRDSIAEKLFDPFALADNALLCTSEPLKQCLDRVDQCLYRRSRDAGQPGTSHFILELTAAHANEMGALTVVFLASLASAGLPRTAQAPEPLRRHAESLRQISMVINRPRTGFGLTSVTGSSLDPGAALLLLTPKPPASMHESLAANIAARCLKLQEEAAATKLEGGPGITISPALAVYKQSVWPKRESASGPSLVASQEAVQTSTGPLHRIVSQTPATPRAIETSMWQRITDWESFNVDTWIKDAQNNGRSEAEKVSDLTKMVGQMQALIRTMAGHLKVSATPISSSFRQRVDASSVDATSPRVALNSPYATPSRQIHNMPLHALASTGNLAACSPRHPQSLSGEEHASPLTRSCSANYPVGSVLSHKGSGLLSIVGEVQSPVAIKRDLSPAEVRHVQSLAPPPKANQQSRSSAPYWMSPWQSAAVLQQPLQQPAPVSVSAESHVLHSPRTEQGPIEGQRSPPPPATAQYAKSAHPNSARTSAPVVSAVFAPGAERSSGLRWEPSPYRVRLVSASAPKVQMAPAPRGTGCGAGAPAAPAPQVTPHHVAVRVGEVRTAAGCTSPPRMLKPGR
ncbi:unnamed protein product [Symbiodinium sp. KB8]|nr:unnamed protein product [Symbiodinium sp. KB8]